MYSSVPWPPTARVAGDHFPSSAHHHRSRPRRFPARRGGTFSGTARSRAGGGGGIAGRGRVLFQVLEPAIHLVGQHAVARHRRLAGRPQGG
ncbi:MAG: hypothetical protein LIP77_08355, partial [Planctomycetes bacterium]|nr:hypothetical protein [Planctomycetota bacterium]